MQQLSIGKFKSPYLAAYHFCYFNIQLRKHSKSLFLENVTFQLQFSSHSLTILEVKWPLIYLLSKAKPTKHAFFILLSKCARTYGLLLTVLGGTSSATLSCHNSLRYFCQNKLNDFITNA